MSAGNPEGESTHTTERFLTDTNSNFTQVTATTAYENGWTPIREDEFERLPDWCLDIYKDRLEGKLPEASNVDVHTAMNAYFSEPKWVSDIIQEQDLKVEPTVVDESSTSQTEDAHMSCDN